MFISSQSKVSMESKKFFYKCFKAHQPKEIFKIKSPNYVVIWSQMFILTQSKVNMESKKLLYKSVKAHQPKEEYEIKSQNYAVI